ncbi:putative reverse transcriptase [Bacillus cereus W]|nr:putative reverse transcriptase [Bacillus cereus W]EDX54365.1 putative reverse transcriptase [Bacillus cereus W]
MTILAQGDRSSRVDLQHASSALMNRPTRGERRFAYWALFRFLAH